MHQARCPASRRLALYTVKLFVTRSLAVLVALILILMTLDLLGESGKILAVPGNSDAIGAFGTQVARHWHKALRRRSQRDRVSWARMNRILARWLPRPRVMHPFPDVRFAAMHPR